MSNDKHTAEPWKHIETRVYLGNEGGFDIRDCPTPEANARRIVACVNACAGVSDAMMEHISASGGVAGLMARNVQRTEQRDKLLEALKTAEAIIADEFTAFDRDLTAGGELTQIRAIIAEIEAAK